MVQQVASPPSTPVAALLVTDTLWLKDPLDPANNVGVKVDPGFTTTTPVKAGKFYPKGQNFAVVVGELEQRGEEFLAAMWALNEDVHVKIMDLLRSGKTLLLQDVIGQQWYVRVEQSIERERLRTQAEFEDLTPVGFTHKINVRFVQVD